MDGLGCTEMLLSQVRDANCRFDSEYYSKDNLLLQKTVNRAGSKTIGEYGGYLDCSAFYPSITEYYSKDRKNNIPFLRVNEICNGLIVLTTDTVFLPCDVIAKNSKTIALAYPGDIIIAKGGNTLAKVGLVPEDFPVYATCRDVVILRTNKLTGLNKYFLWAFLHCKYGQGILRRSASQTGQPHLTLPALLKIKVPDVVSLQELIGELYENTVTLKQGAESLFDGAAKYVLSELGFAAWSPSEKGTCEKKYLDVVATGRLDAEYFRPKYDELFDLLSRCKTRFLGGKNGIVDIQRSIEPGSDAYSNNGVPFVRIANLSEMGITSPEIHIPPEVCADSPRPKKDTILLSKDGSVCIAYKVDDDLNIVTSSGILHLTVKDASVLPDYLALVLNSKIVRLQAERCAGGSIIQHWKQSEIENVTIPILPISCQQQIAAKVHESFALRRKSKALLECARQAVEMAIEQGEEHALKWLQSTVNDPMEECNVRI